MLFFVLGLEAQLNWRLCECSNGLFPVPLARLCLSNKCVFVIAVHDARVLSNIRCFQERLACGSRIFVLFARQGLTEAANGEQTSDITIQNIGLNSG
jgi:hypothetical protein